MAVIQIIVGSVMGTALGVAQTLQQTLANSGHQVSINTLFQRGQLNADPKEILLICTSNTGSGDLPMNIVPFYEHLKNDYPMIAGRRYGLVNLGDSICWELCRHDSARELEGLTGSTRHLGAVIFGCVE